MKPVGHLQLSRHGARMFAVLVVLWLTAIALPCARAETGCPMHDDMSACVLAEGCAAMAPDCAAPEPMLSTVAAPDLPAAPPADVPTVVPTVFVRDLGPRRHWQRDNPQLPPATLHLQSVRLLI